jgi:hypothetical protein
MDESRFDTVARALNGLPSRRAIAGGLVAMLGFSTSPFLGELGAKKKRKHKKKRKQTCPVCGECETCINGACKPAPGGTACGEGGQCLTNGSCAEICTPGSCGLACTCGMPSVEGPLYCTAPVAICDQPQQCATTADCPLGSQCQWTPACGINESRCIPLCQM